MIQFFEREEQRSDSAGDITNYTTAADPAPADRRPPGEAGTEERVSAHRQEVRWLNRPPALPLLAPELTAIYLSGQAAVALAYGRQVYGLSMPSEESSEYVAMDATMWPSDESMVVPTSHLVQANIGPLIAGDRTTRLQAQTLDRANADYDTASALLIESCGPEHSEVRLEWLARSVDRLLQTKSIQLGIERLVEDLLWNDALNEAAIRDSVFSAYVCGALSPNGTLTCDMQPHIFGDHSAENCDSSSFPRRIQWDGLPQRDTATPVGRYAAFKLELMSKLRPDVYPTVAP